MINRKKCRLEWEKSRQEFKSSFQNLVEIGWLVLIAVFVFLAVRGLIVLDFGE